MNHAPKSFVRFFSLAFVALALVPALPVSAAVSSWDQKGISYYPSSSGDFGGTNFQTTLNHYKSLGANTVTLVVQLYQSNDGSIDIGPGGNTPTDASLVSGIQYAHSQGMKVMLKIHLDTYAGDWRANINPSNRFGWYVNYLAQLQHYGQIAQANGVEYFCIGTELVSMSSTVVNSDNTQEWQNMIVQVRKIYSGKLTYDANWGSGSFADEVDGVQFWPSLDFIGISAYYTLPGDGSVSSNESQWANWQNSELGPLESKWNKPIYFTEIGYRSISGAHNAPYDSWTQGSYDPQEQINDYQALFDFWNKYSYMQGADLWYAVSNPSAGGAGDTDYLIMNKPVEQTIQSWFGGGGSTSSGPPAAFSVTGSANPSQTSANQPVTLSTNVTDTGGAGFGDIVDMEVYDSSNHQVFQKIISSQDFKAGATQTYSANWMPTSNGTYSFKVGVFDSNWKIFTWDDSAATISVGSGSSGGSSGGSGGSTGGTSNAILDIWWPTNGTTVSGVQPFKGILENTALSAYNMYWQVDGGQLNQMSDNQSGYPHKESDVDLSGWTWRGGGPYTVNFITKDTSNNLITQKSVQIYVAH